MDQDVDFVDEAERLLAGGDRGAAVSLLDAHVGRVPAEWTWLVDRGSEREIAFWDDEEFRAYVAFFGARLANGLRVTWVGPAYPKAMKLLADDARITGDSARATELLERALDLEPDQPRLLLALSELRESQGHGPEALALADRAATARAWAPRDILVVARDAAVRLRVRLSAAQGASTVTPAEPLRRAAAPRLSLLEDAASAPGGLARFLGAFEGATARVAIVVAGVIGLVLLGVVGFATFRTPPAEARAARFASRLGEYMQVADVPPAPSTPYRRGKIVVVDADSGTIDPIFHLIKSAVQADSPDEADTVAIVRTTVRVVRNYLDEQQNFFDRAYVADCQVSVVDLKSRLAVSRKAFSKASVASASQGEPTVPTDRQLIDDLRPTPAIVQFLNSLPVAPADAPILRVVGDDAPSARPINDSELYDFEFTAASVSVPGSVARTKRRGRAFRETLPSGVAFEMVAVPGGTFGMGVPSTTLYQEDFGEPQHDVSVPSFYLGRVEVTAELWRAVAALPKVARDIDPNPSHLTGDGLPASAISFADANEFCLRLAQATGRPYRMPTEAEWEYAALGGGRGPYPTGTAIDPAIANVQTDPEDPASPKGPKRDGPTPVGGFGVTNGFGLFDVDGNVAEWCLDAFHSSYLEAPRDGSAWLNGSADMRRILRGGAYATLWTEAAAKKRFGLEPTVRFGYFGLRLALSAAPRGAR